jgi:ABC-type transport system substrate-binding protein
MYDPVWEHRRVDPLVEMAALLDRAGIEDFDNDSFLEISDGLGGFIKFTLDFIVNIENAHKLAAAHRIAENLRQFGFSINIRELQWSDFIDELQEGNFDMYYGETLLGADFNFSPLLLPGDGNLNFGRTANTAFLPLINSFLEAETPEEVSYAGGRLCHEIMVSAPFVPILYKRYAIYSPLGVITGAAPTQSGVFHNFQDWSIDLYMLN